MAKLVCRFFPAEFIALAKYKIVKDKARQRNNALFKLYTSPRTLTYILSILQIEYSKRVKCAEFNRSLFERLLLL